MSPQPEDTRSVACQRLQLLGHHLADAPGLRRECSLQWSAGQLQIRPKPMFWVGFGHRDSQADFARLHRLLVALDCPPELLDSHLNHSRYSLYQGVAVDLEAMNSRGTLFMHCRDEIGERRLGLIWDGDLLPPASEYHTGRLGVTQERCWLLDEVHPAYQRLLAELLNDARLIDQGGYWVQYKQGQDTELYLTYPWHPALGSLSPNLNAQLLGTLPEQSRRYRHVPVRHIGFSCRGNLAPAMTFYVSTLHSGRWPLSMGEMEMALPGLAPETQHVHR